MEDSRAKMVGWYDPPRLAAIAIRVAISTVFGEFADRREVLAAAREIDPAALDPAYDYHKAGDPDFWFDFVADCGDGFNPTYAIARLLAQDSVRVADAAGGSKDIPRGSVLVMGGDEVYPTASRDIYTEKLINPYKEALGTRTWQPKPHVYAIPGNHDWYDGLSSFLGLFCRRRVKDGLTPAREGREFGGRETRQTRSYFALRLPQGWWLWGADIQLEGYIDQPQIDFFTHVAENWMEPGSKLILCTGQPSWSYIDEGNPTPAFKNFSYLESIATLAGRNHRLCLVLSGDSHHYARYTEGECEYITAGGGGAFLHPTHQLESKTFDWDYPPPGTHPPKAAKYERSFQLQPTTFPSKEESRCLSWRNLAFAWLNVQYAMTLAGACGFFVWLMHAEAWRRGTSLTSLLARDNPSFIETVRRYVELLFVSPWPLVLVAAAFAGYYYMCDFPRRLAVGVLHGSVQTISVMLLTCVLARLLHDSPDVCLIASVAALGGVLAATLFGIYLLISLNRFGVHWNEAFSSLRIEGYKNFLRLHIGSDGKLTVYPIGLRKVPKEPRSGPLTNPPLDPHLIEPPIEIPKVSAG